MIDINELNVDDIIDDRINKMTKLFQQGEIKRKSRGIYYFIEDGKEQYLNENDINMIIQFIIYLTEDLERGYPYHSMTTSDSKYKMRGSLIYHICNPMVLDLIKEGRFSKDFIRKHENVLSKNSYKNLIEEASKDPEVPEDEIKDMYKAWIKTEIIKLKCQKDPNMPEAAKDVKAILEGEIENIGEFRLQEEFLNLKILISFLACKNITKEEFKRIMTNFEYTDEEKKEAASFAIGLYEIIKLNQEEEAKNYDFSVDAFVSLCVDAGILDANYIIKFLHEVKLKTKNDEENRTIDEDIQRVLNFDKFVAKLHPINIIHLYSEGYAIEKKVLKDNIKNQDIIDAIKNGAVRKELLISFLEKLPREIRPTSELLFDLFEVQPIPKDTERIRMEAYSKYGENSDETRQIEELLSDKSKSVTRCLTGREIFELVKKGFINQEKLVDVYEQQKLFNNVIYHFDEQGYLKNNSNFNDITIWPEEFLMYFNANRVLEMLQNEEYAERFKKMYGEIKLIANSRENTSFIDEYEQNFINSFVQCKKEKNKEYSEDLITLIREEIIDAELALKYLNSKDIMSLLEANKFTLEIVLPYLEGSDIIELFENDENGDLCISDSVLNKLSQKEVEDLILLERITLQEVIDKSNREIITSKVFKGIFKENKSSIIEGIDTGEINPHSILDAYMYGYITAQDIGEIATDKNGRIDINRLNIDEYKFPVNEEESKDQQQAKRQGYVQKIEELLLLGIINYAKLVELKDKELINSDEFRIICDTKANYEAEKEIEGLGVITNYGIAEGNGNNGVLSKIGDNKQIIDCIIDPTLIDEFFDEIGKDKENNITTERRRIEKGALDGYSLIYIKSMGVVVLEKMHTKRTINNATYVVPLIKAVELAKTANKSDLRREPNVKVVNHVKNFGNNILRSIAEVQEETKLPSSNIIWAKDLLNDEDEGVKNLIEEIKKNYDANRKAVDK